jgi:hypothetical protein
MQPKRAGEGVERRVERRVERLMVEQKSERLFGVH